jgi:Domain of unknown function (DUF1998)
MTGQAIRPSQFITTYGPGAILETSKGPRSIRSLGETRGLLFRNRPLSEFEIQDQRLSQNLLTGRSIIRIPTNAEHNLSENTAIYQTDDFPAWSLCVDHELLYRGRNHTNGYRGCPECGGGPHWELRAKARREAIRFVRACTRGHLDDVDWVGAIPHTTQCHRPEILRWLSTGSSLQDITLRCSECNEPLNLGHAYSRSWPCIGRYVELGTQHSDCDRDSKIVQRGAANLRVADVVTALTIPPFDSELGDALQSSVVYDQLAADPDIDPEELLHRLDNLAQRGRIRSALVQTLRGYGLEELAQTMQEVLAGTAGHTPLESRQAEFRALRRAAHFGAPPVQSNTPGSPPRFEVVASDVKSFRLPNGHLMRVTPVSRLRVVMVQRGYFRPVNRDQQAELTEVALEAEGREWLPGVELFGEGVYLDLPPSEIGEVDVPHFPLDGIAAARWYEARQHPHAIGFDKLQPRLEDELANPVFVWWHTFAHRLIIALAIDSGYSAAAIRERVFVEEQEGGQARGGVLLYTAQPGGDGTLGGLIALVPHFDRVLSHALQDIDACSNDPLCSELRIGHDRINGSACYACQMVSETSCEFRNVLLDRMVLAENLP